MTPEDEAAHRPGDAVPKGPSDEQVPEGVPEGVPEEVPEEVPAADGLDLARALTKATAGSSFRKVTRRRKERPSSPGRVSGSHPDDRDPQLLDATLGRLVADHGWEIDLRVHGVFGRWQDLVGAEIADHATPESFADGRLVVRTDSTAWATQLRLLAPTVVRRLNEELGHGTVTAIEGLGPHGPSWKKGRLTSRDGRGPRDTYG
jgi:predicted nucleic acid-binding Zn ribbon protein